MKRMVIAFPDSDNFRRIESKGRTEETPGSALLRSNPGYLSAWTISYPETPAIECIILFRSIEARQAFARLTPGIVWRGGFETNRSRHPVDQAA